MGYLVNAYIGYYAVVHYSHQNRIVRTLIIQTASLNSTNGAGSHGRRMGDMAGYNTNIEVKTIVSPEISARLLEELKHFPPNHALIAFRQSVEGLFN